MSEVVNTSRPIRIAIVMGTRPEVIKLAPLVIAARQRPDDFEVLAISTAQHRQMLDQAVAQFGIAIDEDLGIMQPDQSPADVIARALTALSALFARTKPDVVVVQGDTATTLAGALAAYLNRIAVAHVEAGLRTHDKWQPFPEEINRRLTSPIADYHFAPTDRARDNLLREGIEPHTISVTGNTAIDALLWMLWRVRAGSSAPVKSGRLLLVTAHRRENHGPPLDHICDALLTLLDRFADTRVLLPVHLNPRVQSVVRARLGQHPRIQLVAPLGYEEMVRAIDESYLILTDSGGLQEEAPGLGKPVLVLRETTERPEAIEAGVAMLVGTDADRIVTEASRLLTDPAAYAAMAHAKNPFGDGTASVQILNALSADRDRILAGRS